MKITIYADPVDFTLAARAAQRAVDSPNEHSACQFGEGFNVREFHTRRTKTGAITVWQVKKPQAWPS